MSKAHLQCIQCHRPTPGRHPGLNNKQGVLDSFIINDRERDGVTEKRQMNTLRGMDARGGWRDGGKELNTEVYRVW